MSAKLFSLPQLEVELVEGLPGAGQPQLVVAGGRVPAGAWLQAAAAGRTVTCADKGIEVCLQAGLAVAELYGDSDSAAAAAYEEAARQGVVIHRFPWEKDDTDLQLVLQQLPLGSLCCSGIWGGRFDHLYSNVFSLLAYKLRRQVQVCLADEHEFMLLLQAGEAVELVLRQQPEALSLLPLSPAAQVDLQHVHWPLEQAELTMLHPYAISNIPQQRVFCRCRTGMVGLYASFS